MRRAIGAALMLFSAACAVAADYPDFSYNYVQLYAFDAKDSERDIETSAPGFELSAQSRGGGFIRLSYENGDVDELRGVSASDRDYIAMQALFGGASQLNDRLSVWTGIGVAYEEVDTSVTVNNYAYSMELGLRYWLLPRVEVNGSVVGVRWDYHESDGLSDSYREGYDTDLGVELGLRVYPLKRLSIGGSASGMVDGRTERYEIDLRWNY